jgi:hypothetical protein
VGRLTTATATGLLVLVTAAGCGVFASVPDAPTNPNKVDPVALVGSGSEFGGWRAWVYRTGVGDLCLEVRGVNRGGVRCDRGDDALAGPATQVAQQGTFVLGGTRIAAASSVEIRMADDSIATGQLVEPGGLANGLRVYVVAVASSARPVSVEVAAADGKVLETSGLGG